MQRQSEGLVDMLTGDACDGNNDISHYAQVEDIMPVFVHNCD